MNYSEKDIEKMNEIIDTNPNIKGLKSLDRIVLPSTATVRDAEKEFNRLEQMAKNIIEKAKEDAKKIV